MANSSSSFHSHALLIFSLLLVLATLTFLPANADHSHSLPYNSSPPSSAPSPSPLHHRPGHHHRHPHHSQPPTQPPTYSSAPPSKPPTLPPAKPPTTYPSAPPAKPPTVAPVKPPTTTPAKPPTYPSPPPTKGPAYPPVKPPYHPLPERKLVAVQGVVYCKNCSYAGVNTFLGASPLPGASVELRCRNTKYNVRLQTAKTDKNGYFFLLAPPLVTTYGAHKCHVSLVPTTKHNKNFTTLPCTQPTALNGGVSGAPLILTTKDTSQPGGGAPTKALPFALYTVGPFAFEPPKCLKH